LIVASGLGLSDMCSGLWYSTAWESAGGGLDVSRLERDKA
jgi:hypothetical protein